MKTERLPTTALLFIAVWALSSVGFYFRYPLNLDLPNFFAEDGMDFAHNIQADGILKTVFTPFNGYFAVGVYLLTFIGKLLNTFLYGGEYVFWPAALAITSYAFLGLCAASPIVLLRTHASPILLAGAAAVITLMPMPQTDFQIIGAVGNLKFPFAYLAAMLMIYRMRLPYTSPRLLLVDLGLAICVLTTAGAYIVLPFILLCDGLGFHQLFKPKFMKLTNLSLIGGFLLGLVALWQIGFVATHGIKPTPGYLDQSFQFANLIELTFARPVLYALLSPFYDTFNDIIVVTIMALLVAAIVTQSSARHIRVYLVLAATIFATTGIFAVFRPGISEGFRNYTVTNLDNFYFTQNFLTAVLFAVLLSDINSRLAWFRKFRIAEATIVLIAIGAARSNHLRIPNDFQHYEIGTLMGQLAKKCALPGDTVTYSANPFHQLLVTEDRSVACTKSVSMAGSRLQDFGLRPGPGIIPFFLKDRQGTFTQTFTASRDKLAGLALYYSASVGSDMRAYVLTISDASCQRVLRSVSLPERTHDGWNAIAFPPIEGSTGVTYCFSVTQVEATTQPLAVILSADNVFLEGRAELNGEATTRDVIFSPLYAR